MKNNNIYIVFLLFFVFGCTKDFEEINTDPYSSSEPVPEYLFTNALLQGTWNTPVRQGAELAQAACYVQHLASTAFNWNGDKYIFNGNNNDALFDNAYKNGIKTTEEVIRLSRDGNRALFAAARIWRVLLYHRITDAYGDVPYFEAGTAAAGGAFYPKYDPQEQIYKAMLRELDEACLILDDVPTAVTGDILYFGDVEKWRKFGYSLMLRLAMRCTEADADLAKNWAEKAVQGGVMEALDQSAIIFHTNGPAAINENAAAVWVESQIGNPRLSKTLVDSLLAHNDPRIAVFANPADTVPYNGLPVGSSEETLANMMPPQLVSEFSQVNYGLFTRATPTLLLSYAEVELLKAEMATRAWTTSETAEAHFQKGMAASIAQWNEFYGQVIDNQQVMNYVSKRVFSTDPSLQQAQIGYELWLTFFLNPMEAWANWRRTGHPQLTPAAYPFSTCPNTIPRRFLYPNSEKSTNNANVLQAIQHIGGDECTTQVWWDRN